MKWIGLTGGMASGKSTVGRILEESGFWVLDADILARDAVAKGEKAHGQVVQAFGEEILLECGEIDRPKLGSIVFNSWTELEKLESIVHPVVEKLAEQRREDLEKTGVNIAFYMVPLLYEKGSAPQFDEVVLVHSETERQIQRVQERDRLTAEQVQLRLDAQMPSSEKLALADYVLENNGTPW